MIIGVCSYGNTGSGALLDLLREYEELEVLAPENTDFEFKYAYMPDGIEDLEYHLCNSPMRWRGCDTAIKRFIDVSKFYSMPHSLIMRMTKGKYKKLTIDYIKSLIQLSWMGQKSYEYMHNGKAGQYVYRLRSKLYSILYHRFKKDVRTFPVTSIFFSYYPDDFEKKSKEYLQNLIDSMRTTSKQKMVLDQPFSGDHPQRTFKFYNDPYAIVVDRDPRDLYIIAKYYLSSMAYWIPTQRVEDFVIYYRQMRTAARASSERVLYIRFEDLIYEYEKTVKRIEEFLSIYKKNGKNVFKPEISIRNTQIFNAYPNEEENIKYIEKTLCDWIYPFDKYHVVTDHKDVF